MCWERTFYNSRACCQSTFPVSWQSKVVSTYLLTSLPAEMVEGTGYGSSTVTFLYPLRASQRAVDEPQVPQPTMRMLVEAGSVGLRLLEVMVLYTDTTLLIMAEQRSR